LDSMNANAISTRILNREIREPREKVAASSPQLFSPIAPLEAREQAPCASKEEFSLTHFQGLEGASKLAKSLIRLNLVESIKFHARSVSSVLKTFICGICSS
jgi:hypothetical protein